MKSVQEIKDFSNLMQENEDFRKRFKSSSEGLDIIDADGFAYEIDSQLIDTYEKAFNQLQHMLEKNWFYEDVRYARFYISFVQERLKEK